MDELVQLIENGGSPVDGYMVRLERIKPGGGGGEHSYMQV